MGDGQHMEFVVTAKRVREIVQEEFARIRKVEFKRLDGQYQTIHVQRILFPTLLIKTEGGGAQLSIRNVADDAYRSVVCQDVISNGLIQLYGTATMRYQIDGKLQANDAVAGKLDFEGYGSGSYVKHAAVNPNDFGLYNPKLYGKLTGNSQLIEDYLQKHAAKTSAYTTVAADRIIGVDTSGGAVTITLGSATVAAGRAIIIKDEGGAAATNNITVATEGAETIDGAATDVINTNYGSCGYYSNGTNWFKV